MLQPGKTIDVWGSIYNVTDNFGGLGGADPTGIVDSRTKIQAAIDACNGAGGGVVYFPKGTYLVTIGTQNVALKIGSNTLVRFAPGAVVKLAASQPQDARIFSNYTAWTSGVTETNIGFENVTIDGNGANQTVDRQHGILLSGVAGAWFDHVTIKNVRGTTGGANGPGGQPGEGFFFQLEYCSNVVYEGCEAYRDAGSCSSGFSATHSQSVHHNNCISREMTVANGFTHDHCRQMLYTNCHAYRNYLYDFNSEDSESMVWAACEAGGRNVNAITLYTANQNLGLANGNDTGFVVQNGTNFRIVGCVSRKHSYGGAVDATSSNGSVTGDFSDNATAFGSTLPATVDVFLGAGTAFPVLATAGPRFYRSDLGWMCFYDGTRWLTENEFSVSWPGGVGTSWTAISANGNTPGIPLRTDYEPYFTRYRGLVYVDTTNDASHYWTVTGKTATGNTVFQFDTHGIGPNTWGGYEATPTGPGASGATHINIDVAKTSTPGNLNLAATLYYRLVVT